MVLFCTQRRLCSLFHYLPSNTPLLLSSKSSFIAPPSLLLNFTMIAEKPGKRNHRAKDCQKLNTAIFFQASEFKRCSLSQINQLIWSQPTSDESLLWIQLANLNPSSVLCKPQYNPPPPHSFTEDQTEMTRAASQLNWCCLELKRY